jgi:hypothetical protein
VSIAEQIARALRQQTEAGGYNVAEEIIYEPENGAVITGIYATIKRGEGKTDAVMGAEYEDFEAEVLVYRADLGTVTPRAGDQIRLADQSELWRVKGIRAEIPGGVLLRCTRKLLRRVVEA